MTVEELIAELSKLDPRALVILQRDPEGNGYSPLSGVEDNGSWDNDEREYGYAEFTPELEEAGYSEEDCIEGVPAVVLWPSW